MQFKLNILSNAYRFIRADVTFYDDENKTRKHQIECKSNGKVCRIIFSEEFTAKDFYTSGMTYSLRIMYYHSNVGGFKTQEDNLDFTIDKSIKFTLNVPPQTQTMKGRKISDLEGVFTYYHDSNDVTSNSSSNSNTKKRSHEKSNTSTAESSKKKNTAITDSIADSIYDDFMSGTPKKMTVRSYSEIMNEIHQKEEQKKVIPLPVAEDKTVLVVDDDPVLQAIENLQKEYKNKAIELKGLTDESEQVKKQIEQFNNTKTEIKQSFERLILQIKESEEKLNAVDASINDKRAEIARIKERFTF
jgi:hypothetical protein